MKLIVSTLLICFVWAGITNGQEKQLDLVRVGVSAFTPSFIPIFIASKRGLYADEGITAEIILLSGLIATRALIAGDVDFASATNASALVQGFKLKMVMVFNDKPNMELVVQRGIKSAGELRGKKIAVTSIGSVDHQWLRDLLPKFGLNPGRDVTFVGMGGTGARFAGMQAGSVDAALIGAPHLFVAQDLGFSTLLKVSDHLDDIIATIVTTDEKLSRRESQVNRFLRGTIKGLRVYLSKPEDAVTSIMEFTRLRDRRLARMTYEQHLTTIARDGLIPERLQRFVIQRAKRNVGVTRDVRSEEVFDFSFLRQAAVDLDRSGWRP